MPATSNGFRTHVARVRRSTEMGTVSGKTKRKRGRWFDRTLARLGAVSVITIMLAVALLPLASNDVLAEDDDEVAIIQAEVLDEPEEDEVVPVLVDEQVVDDVDPEILD